MYLIACMFYRRRAGGVNGDALWYLPQGMVQFGYDIRGNVAGQKYTYIVCMVVGMVEIKYIIPVKIIYVFHGSRHAIGVMVSKYVFSQLGMSHIGSFFQVDSQAVFNFLFKQVYFIFFKGGLCKYFLYQAE